MALAIGRANCSTSGLSEPTDSRQVGRQTGSICQDLVTYRIKAGDGELQAALRVQYCH
jgi:hypothetical protein